MFTIGRVIIFFVLKVRVGGRVEHVNTCYMQSYYFDVLLFDCRHHVYKKTGGKEVELKEVGPRFELRCEHSM